MWLATYSTCNIRSSLLIARSSTCIIQNVMHLICQTLLCHVDPPLVGFAGVALTDDCSARLLTLPRKYEHVACRVLTTDLRSNTLSAVQGWVEHLSTLLGNTYNLHAESRPPTLGYIPFRRTNFSNNGLPGNCTHWR